MALSKIRSNSIADTAVTGRRNVLINGGFQIWQRSTSSSSTGVKTADRWYYNPSGATGTASRQSFTDGQTAVPGNPQFYMNLNITTGNDNAGLQYRIEATHDLANDVYTLSFWAKSDTARELTLQSQSHDLSADVFFNNTVSPTTFTPTSSWQKFTFKVTHGDMDTLGSFASGDYTRLIISQGSDTSTTAWELDLAQVQLEKGEVATPFEYNSYADELQRCSRYYQQITYEGGSAVAIGFQSSTSGAQAVVYYPYGLMRAAPTITLPSAGQGANLMTFLKKNTGYPTTTGTHAGQKANTAQYFLTATGYAGLDGGGLGTWLYTGSSSGSITFKYDAEL